MKYQQLTIPLMLISLPGIFLWVLLPIYIKELGYTTFQYSITISILSFTKIILKLVLGKVSDRYSRHRICLYALVSYTAAYFIYAAATTLSTLIAAIIVHGIAGILLTMALIGLVSDSNHKLGQQMGAFDSKQQIGSLAGVGICYLVLSSFGFIQGWGVLFLICGAASLLGCIYIFKSPEVPNTKEMAIQKKEKSKLSVKQRKIWVFNLGLSTVSAMSGIIFIPYMQQVYGAGIELITAAFLVPMLIFPFVSSKLGRVGDQRGYRKTIIQYIPVLCMGALGLAFSPSLLLFAIIYTIMDLFSSIQAYALDGVFIKGTPQSHIGDAYGKFTISANLGGMAGAALGGYLFDAFGPSVPYIVFAVSILLFLPLGLYLIPASKEQSVQERLV
ncbi:MFS transporter [Paenibacillus sp. AN1007]|uniref:MFS transporter n=1 Tax=Paenibacillus sp. AN1007 TaxID=3151385 RepID=A0AAU8NBN2_9BACL